MRNVNMGIQGEKPVHSVAGELYLDDWAEQAARKEPQERLSNIEFD